MSLPQRVDFVRHPHWAGNLEATQSLLASDRDLNEGPDHIGRQQAIAFGRDVLRHIWRPVTVVSSPFLRAYGGARIAARQAWPNSRILIMADDRLSEQNKGTDPSDHYNDDELFDRPYPAGETLRQVGTRALDFVRDPKYANKHLIAFTHARFMLSTRMAIGGYDYTDLRDHGLAPDINGIMIGHCQQESYLRLPDPDSGDLPEWFSHLQVRQTWGDAIIDSGPIPLRSPKEDA